MFKQVLMFKQSNIDVKNADISLSVVRALIHVIRQYSFD